jgi:hypothetical protein
MIDGEAVLLMLSTVVPAHRRPSPQPENADHIRVIFVLSCASCKLRWFSRAEGGLKIILSCLHGCAAGEALMQVISK